MKEIKCPKCGTVFKIDENDYNEILERIYAINQGEDC